MAVLRINKTKDYTVMSNYHFREKEMSLKAKGLLSQMLSLPDEWDYSIAGLAAINKENETSIKSTLNELKDFRYLKVTKLMPNETDSGRIEYIYDIYEQPYEKQEEEKQEVENLGVEFQAVENHGQYNTNKSNTKELNIKELNNNNTYIPEKPAKSKKAKEPKHKYGEYQHILLTDKEYEKLVAKYGASNMKTIIEYFDKKLEMKGYKYKSHYLAILDWGAKAALENRNKETLGLFKRLIEA